MQDKLAAGETLSAGLVSLPAAHEKMEVLGRYTVECVRDGEVIWTEAFDNLVTTVGKNSMLDKFLDLGAAHSAIHMGLKGSGSAAASDTMSSHAAWSQLDITASRPVPAFSAAASGSKTQGTASTHTITAAGPTTVAGVYIVVSGTSANTNTTGTLFSAGDFSLARSVIAADVLNVTYTLAL